MEAPFERDIALRPQRTEDRDLLLEDLTPLFEGHPERVVLDLVPADPESESELAPAHDVDLGRLLGQQGRLALGPDENGGGEGQVGEAGQVGEHRQWLAERIVDRVRPADVTVHAYVRPENMVVGGEVRKAQVGRGLPDGAHGAEVVAQLGLREDHADVHDRAVCPASTPARARRTGPATLAVVKLRIFVEPQQGASYDTLLSVAQAAEAAGFDAFFRSDHFLTMGGDGLPGPTDAWLTLGAIARETERIRLGTLVTSATFRGPGLLAIEVAQVDAMSGGRVELGLGAGWYEAEHTAYGFEFPPLGERFERLEETFAILTGLWGTPDDEKFSFDGRHFHLKDSPALPKPAQHPHPPLIVGGGGAKRTPRLAATYANEFNLPFSSLNDTEAQYARVRAACADRGRDPKTLHLSAAQVVCCGRDEAEIERRAARIGRKPDELRANGAAGTPDEVVARLEAFAAIGAETVYLQVLDLHDLEHVELLAQEVLPRVS